MPPACESVDRRCHGAATSHEVGESGDRNAAMLRQQPVANCSDGATSTEISGLYGEVAFAVGSHRSVADVRRTDAHEAVVNDHDLRMHHDVGDLLAFGDLRMHDA